MRGAVHDLRLWRPLLVGFQARLFFERLGRSLEILVVLFALARGFLGDPCFVVVCRIDLVAVRLLSNFVE